MKAKIGIILFVLAAVIGSGITAVSAQEDSCQEFKNVIADYLDAYLKYDIDAVMKYISKDYYVLKNDKEINYDMFKKDAEKHIKMLSETYRDLSISGLEIIESYIMNNEAILVVEYVEKGFNLKTNTGDIIEKSRSVILVNEAGSWKISQWKYSQEFAGDI
jgi:hypothetical protein